MSQRRVAILGGTFNPVHNGHVALANAALAQCEVDQVLWIPAGDPPHKALEPGATTAQRLEMVHLAIAEHPRFDTSELEIRRQGRSYAVLTLETLHQQHPDWHWFWIIGADALQDLPKWYQVQRLVSLCTWLVAPRPAMASPAAILNTISAEIGLPVNGIPLTMPWHDISSTQIRQRLQQQQSITDLVPPAVASYIEQQGLYRDPDR